MHSERRLLVPEPIADEGERRQNHEIYAGRPKAPPKRLILLRDDHRFVP
jgi:hypothetical protein